jgi:hypothetical protein
MRRFLVCTALALLGSAAIPMAAAANHSEGQGNGPKFEKVDGRGESGSQGHIHVNAKDQGGPQGHVVLIQGGTEAEGVVTCLNVNNNRGLIGARVTQSTNPAYPPNSRLVIGVEDNGEGNEPNDRHFRTFPGEPPPFDQNCNNPAFFLLFGPAPGVQQGDYIVHDD